MTIWKMFKKGSRGPGEHKQKGDDLAKRVTDQSRQIRESSDAVSTATDELRSAARALVAANEDVLRGAAGGTF